MKTIAITDSNSGISQEEATKLGIKLVPMPFLIDGEEYFEDISLSQQQFYEKLTENAQVSTSQPSLYDLEELFTNTLKEYDEIVYIPMSSGLSNSCESATALANNFNGRVFVVNNKRISVTQKQSVLDALNLIKIGKTASEIKQILEENALNSSIYIMVSTLKYLKKGGRITPAAAAIGSLLKIKPILQIQGEKLDKFSQVMAFNMGKKKMIDQMVKDLSTRFSDDVKNNKINVSIAYTNCIEKAKEFENEVNTALLPFNLKVECVDPLSLSVACHIGDGALAVAISQKI